MFYFDTLRRFVSDRNGATSIEYALIASSIGGVVAVMVWLLGDVVRISLSEKLLALM